MLHKLSESSVRELQAIWKAETGEDLTLEETEAMGLRILRVFQVLERMPAPLGIHDRVHEVRDASLAQREPVMGTLPTRRQLWTEGIAGRQLVLPL